MKKIKLFSFLALVLLLGCTQKAIIDNAEQVGISKITYYITFQLTGGSTVVYPLGTTYVDPGYTAMEGTKDVTSKVQVQGTVNGNQVGLYTLTYVAVNSDGFSSSTTRTVIIYNPAAPAADLGGTYSSNVSRVNPARSFTGLIVTITKLAPGFFYCSDFGGGFYAQGSNYGYGPGGAFPGYFELNPDNTITLVSSTNTIWGVGMSALQNTSYNPATNGIYWDAIWNYGPYDFQVTLTKQ
jgi:hypothetical protein